MYTICNVGIIRKRIYLKNWLLRNGLTLYWHWLLLLRNNEISSAQFIYISIGSNDSVQCQKNRLAPEHAQRAHYFTMHLFDEIVVRHCNLLEFKVMWKLKNWKIKVKQHWAERYGTDRIQLKCSTIPCVR